jgi:hypothetical protein
MMYIFFFFVCSFHSFCVLTHISQLDQEKWKVPLVTKLDPKKNGMIHFFPAVCDCLELDAQFKRRGVKHNGN